MKISKKEFAAWLFMIFVLGYFVGRLNEAIAVGNLF